MEVLKSLCDPRRVDLVREFYANIHEVCENSFKVKFRGVLFQVEQGSFNSLSFAEFPHLPNSKYPYKEETNLTRGAIIRCFIDNAKTGCMAKPPYLVGIGVASHPHGQ